MVTAKYQIPRQAPAALASLLANWQAVADRRPPRLDDLPFDELVKQHPGLALTEPCAGRNGKSDYKYARVGPEFSVRTGRNLEGLSLSQALHPTLASPSIDVHTQVKDTGCPHYWEVTNAYSDAPPQEYARLLLPIYGAHGDVECFMSCCVWKS